ncbi:hypothetical protein PG997_004025 [Apiospora hydei]|uniref:AB hydrolase-1 domain-containing protein n=1 Tax=Apiospora hydei TaxID=1337664 RepID=A0ABR1X0V4_9PEZI
MPQSAQVAAVAVLLEVGSARHCQNLTIPISISARNGKFDLQAPATNIEVTNFVLNLAQPGHNLTEAVLDEVRTKYVTVGGNYSIAATYCEPDCRPGKTVQVLTHGIAFDRSYWDFPVNNYNYSYVNQAVDRGHSAFFFDRLGLGQSSRGEPVNEIQSWLEVSALYALTTMIRENRIPEIKAKFDKIVHVGHSFGSIQTYGLVAAYPDSSDGIVLTGFSQAAFLPYFLLGNNFVSANTIPALVAYPVGYLAASSVSGAQIGFFSPGQFDPWVLQAAAATGQPVTVGELLTVGGPSSPKNAFRGPVFVVTGERDIPFCGGYCLQANRSIPAEVKSFFTNTSYFGSFVVPKAGHGLNLEFTWPITYGRILGFIDDQVSS